jgi:hypothetical protein
MSFINHSITTHSHKAASILSFMRRESIFLSLSKDLAWDSSYGPYIEDINPPKPSPYLTHIDNLLAMVRVYEVLPALLSPCGETYLSGKRWHLIRDLTDMRLERGLFIPSPTHLYVSCLIEPDYYQSDSIRVLGLHSLVSLTIGANPNQISFPASQVSDQGILHWSAYCSPIDRLLNKQHKIELLIDI